MKRRIYSGFILLIIPCVLILSVALSFLFHNAAKDQELVAVREQARLMSDLLDSGVTGGFQFSDFRNMDSGSTRMTIIATDGTVLLDNIAAADRMENHADRPEIIEAFRSGSGESLRYSATLRTETYYFAVQLGDGSVLRVSRAIGGLADVFAVALPIAAGVTILLLVVAGAVARRLTDRIIAPLSGIDFDGSNTAVYDELLPFVDRIDRQKKELDERMAQLVDRAETIQAITGNMKEGLILIDSGASVLSANNSASEIFGDNIEMKNVMHICRDEGFRDAVRQCLSGENVEMQMERARKIYSVFLSPVNSGYTTRGAVIFFQDATERHRAEKQRREFSANVSHELKTPLTTISALSEMIGSGMAKDDDVKGFAARISEQSGRLLRLIDDIIRLSEFDEGGAEKEDTVFDLRELAEAVADSLRDNSRGVGISVSGERLELSANRHMIDELLYNLIDNGVKYNKDGGSVLVELCRTESGLCKIAVSDTGIGIPAQHHAHIFERFYRVDKSRSKKTGGTGLGLSIVKHIAEYHGGYVVLSSAEGEGTTVTCYFNSQLTIDN